MARSSQSISLADSIDPCAPQRVGPGKGAATNHISPVGPNEVSRPDITYVDANPTNRPALGDALGI